MRTASPEELAPAIGDYFCEDAFSDKDYQIKLSEFDENLRGGAYDCLRYRVNNATKRGYTLSVGKEITPAHSYIMAYHISRKNYNIWDYQLYLRLQNYVGNSRTAKLFNVSATVVMPETVTPAKRSGAERLGARVELAGTTTKHRYDRAQEIAEQEGLTPN